MNVRQKMKLRCHAQLPVIRRKRRLPWEAEETNSAQTISDTYVNPIMLDLSSQIPY